MKSCRARTRRSERGAVAILSALITVVLLLVSALVVDFGMTWMRRGELQEQADKAALFAAAALPATDEGTRLRVAQRAAYYLACYAVPGQRTLDPAIPDCPGGSYSSAGAGITTYAHHLLDTGQVTFPSSTQVQVVTPRAQVDYAFAGVTGVEDTVQTKAATAKVSSPGEIMPVGLSLQCLASAVNQAGLGSRVDGVLPLGYITPGAYSSSGTLPTDSEPTFSGWESAYTGSNASAGVTVANPTVTGSTLTVSVGAPVSLTLSNLLSGAKVAFKRGSDPAVVVSATALTAAGTLTATIPSSVLSTPGIWHVKVQLYTSGLVLGTMPKWSALDVQVTVYPSTSTVTDRVKAAVSGLLDTRDLLACGRLLDSPRVQDGGTPALTRNLQENLDHPLTPNQALLQALSTQDLSMLDGSAARLDAVLSGTVQSILTNPAYGLMGCSGSADNRLDTQQTYDATQSAGAAPANCVRIASSSTTEQELTDGLLKDSPSSPVEPGYGRLSCSRDGACDGATTTLPGFSGTYNDDSFSDFLRDGSSTLLDSNLAFALDTYLLPGLPGVTPSDAIRSDIYSSARFGWVPVLSYVDLNTPGQQDYPILTFRPIFLDNGTAPDLHIAGLGVGSTVDGLPANLQARLQAAIDDVRTSLGVLGSALDAVLQPLGLSTALSDLGDGDVNGALSALSNGLGMDMGQEKAGLLIQGGEVKAARFLTIAPAALPAVSTSYDGPTTDYLGVGPKIVRLVR